MSNKVFSLEPISIDGYPFFKNVEWMKVGSIGVSNGKTYKYDGCNWIEVFIK